MTTPDPDIDLDEFEYVPPDEDDMADEDDMDDGPPHRPWGYAGEDPVEA